MALMDPMANPNEPTVLNNKICHLDALVPDWARKEVSTGVSVIHLSGLATVSVICQLIVSFIY